MSDVEWYVQWPIQAQTINGEPRLVKVGLLKTGGRLDGQFALQVDDDEAVVLPFPTQLSAGVRSALNERGERGW